MMPLWLVLLAVAMTHLPLVSTQESPPPSIDLKMKGDAYFGRQSCVTSGRSAGVLVIMYTPEDCDVVIHTRHQGLKKLKFEIQIKKGSTDLDETASVKLSQGPFSIECKPDRTVTATGNDKISIEKPSVFFSKDLLFCAFTMKSDEKITDAFSTATDKPTLHFKTIGGGDEDIVFDKVGDTFWSQGQRRCDRELLKPIADSDEGYTETPTARMLYNVKDVAADNLQCAYDKGKLYIKFADNTLVNSITCGEEWKFELAEMPGREFTLDEPFQPVCFVQYCSECGKPFKLDTCDTCEPPVYGVDDNGCSTLTCTSKNYYINGKWAYIPEGLTCSGNKDKKRPPKWRTILDGEEKEVKFVACNSEFVCHNEQPLVLHECEDEELETGACGEINEGNYDSFTCEHPDRFVLQIGDVYSNDTIVKCDPNTGFYMNNNETIEKGTIISCTGQRHPVEVIEKHAEAQVKKARKRKIRALMIIFSSIFLGISLMIVAYVLARMLNAKDRARVAAEEVLLREHAALMKAIRVKDEQMSIGQSIRARSIERMQRKKPLGFRLNDYLESSSSEGKKSKRPRNNCNKTDVDIASDREKAEISEKSSIKSGKEKGGDTFIRRSDIPRLKGPPPLDDYEITDENLVPSPRFPEIGTVPQHSTAMEICNKRLVELKKMEKGTTTASTSVMPKDGGGEKETKSKEEKIPSKNN